jgi:hypothetical protein
MATLRRFFESLKTALAGNIRPRPDNAWPGIKTKKTTVGCAKTGG